jgi:outer membrane biosynthesis protein TonB
VIAKYPDGVSIRLTGALVAAFALLAVLPSVAAADLSRGPQRVYDDYRDDAALTPCDHSVKTYRRTLREITPDIEEETPAFRPAVEAALRERDKQQCAAPGSGEPQNAAPLPGATPASPPPSAQPAQPAQPAPVKPVKPVKPVQPLPAQPAKPVPSASATPTPTVAPAAPVTSSAPAPASAPVLLDRPHEGTPVGLLIALGILALSLLAALLAFALRDAERFAGARHAWGEAAYRAGGTWADFVDWARR